MKATLSFSILAGFFLLCFTAACGSDSDDGAKSKSTLFSCSITSEGVSQCADYRASDAAQRDAVRKSCTQNGGTVGQGCPTAGVSGICAAGGSGAGARLFYYGVSGAALGA